MNMKIITLLRPEKPSPIFVDRVDNISPLIQLLNDCSKDSYKIKVQTEIKLRCLILKTFL